MAKQFKRSYVASIPGLKEYREKDREHVGITIPTNISSDGTETGRTDGAYDGRRFKPSYLQSIRRGTADLYTQNKGNESGLLEKATGELLGGGIPAAPSRSEYQDTNRQLQSNALKMLGIYSLGKVLDKDISQSQTLAGLVRQQNELQQKKTDMLTENPELKDPGTLERIGKTLSGAMKQWGASNINSAATQYAAGSEHRDMETDERLKEAQAGLERYQKLYREALAEGDPNGDAGNYKNMIDHYQRQVDAYAQVPEVQQGAARESMQLADTLAESGAGDIQRAKQGAGKFGQMMVDVGAAGTQTAADMLAGKALGTKANVPMMFRSFGGAAQEARQDGATIGEQMAYGAASAAVSGLTEQLSNVAKLFKGAFGKGVADDLVDTAIDKAVKRFAATEGGKAILRSGLQLGASAAGEGFEEMVEDIVNPMVKLIYQAKGQAPYGILARTYAENFDLEETLYDGLIGAAMGLIGGTPEAIGNTVQGIRGNTETAGGYSPDAPADIGQIIDDVRAKGGSAMQRASSDVNPAMEQVLDSVNEAVNGQKKSADDSGVIVYSGNSALDRPTGLAYTLASNRDQISDMNPVKALTGTEMNAKSKKPSEQIREFFAKIGNKVFRPNFGEVSLNEYGVGGMLNHRPLNRAKMVTLSAVPEVIESGRIIAETENWKNRGYKSIVFAAPVTINGKTVYVAAVVDQRPDNKFYLSECVDSEGNFVRIKESPTGDAKSGVTAQGGFTTTPNGGSFPVPHDSADAGTHQPQSQTAQGPMGTNSAPDGSANAAPQMYAQDVRNDTSIQSIPQSQAQYNPNFNQNQGGDTGSPVTRTGAQPSEAGANREGRGTERADVRPEGRMQQGGVSSDAVGAAEAGSTGDTERGFSKNIASDKYMDYKLREDYRLDPEMYHKLGNADTLQKANDVMNQGLDTARAMLEQAIGASKNGMKFPPEMVPLARMVANQLVKDGDLDGARRILSDVAVELTAAGQLGQAAVILRNSGPAARLRTINRALEEINQAGRKRYGDKWKDFGLTKEERRAIRNMADDSDAEFEALFDAVAKRVGESMPSTVWEKVTEIRRVAMLLNPKTQLRNPVANVPLLLERKVAEKISGILQDFLVKKGKLKKGEQTRTVRTTKESREIARQLYEANKETLLNDSNKWDMNGMMRQYRKYFGNSRPGQAMDAIREFTYMLLEEGDQPFFPLGLCGQRGAVHRGARLRFRRRRSAKRSGSCSTTGDAGHVQGRQRPG